MALHPSREKYPKSMNQQERLRSTASSLPIVKKKSNEKQFALLKSSIAFSRPLQSFGPRHRKLKKPLKN